MDMFTDLSAGAYRGPGVDQGAAIDIGAYVDVGWHSVIDDLLFRHVRRLIREDITAVMLAEGG
jgi:hypothetical protein